MNNEVTQDEVDSKVLHKLYELETSENTKNLTEFDVVAPSTKNKRRSDSE